MDYLLMQLLIEKSLVLMGGRECHSPLTAMYSYSFPSKITSQLLIMNFFKIFFPPLDHILESTLCSYTSFVIVCCLLLCTVCVQ